MPLYVYVLIGLVLGALLGFLNPSIAVNLKVLGDAFIKLLRMLISPIVFLTVSLGIAGMNDLRHAGRIGAKALVYFEVMSIIALGLGLLIVNGFKPGEGLHIDVNAIDAAQTANIVHHGLSIGDFLLNVIPKSFLEGLSGTDLLQTLLIAVLFGAGLAHLKAKAIPIIRALETTSSIFLWILQVVMRLAPLGVFGAMAFTVGKYGHTGLLGLARVLGTFYLTCAVFILGVLGAVARAFGFRITSLLWYLRRELLTGLGTASSESVLAPLILRMEQLGCSRALVGLVIPSGYCFNMDGGSLYLTVATLFLAQALDIHLLMSQQLSILGVGLIMSKGSSGVTGSGFIVLAATLAMVPSVPASAVVLLVGIDRFMGVARVFTNIIGNAVAVLVVSRWERELDVTNLKSQLRERTSGFLHP